MKGYVLCVRLLSKYNYDNASLKLTKLALERLDHSNTNERMELEDIMVQTLEKLRTQKNPFEKLPLELSVRIFEEVSQGLIWTSYRDSLKTLCSVCHLWGSIVRGTPSLWRNIVVFKGLSQRCLDAWILRVNGLCTLLYMSERDGCPKIDNVSEKFWASIKVLYLDYCLGYSGPFTKILPTGAFGHLAPTDLTIKANDRGNTATTFWDGIMDTNTSRLKKIELFAKNLPWKYIGALTSLVSLTLHGFCPVSNLISCLSNLPRLLTLSIQDDYDDANDEYGNDACVDLNNLYYLKINSERLSTRRILRRLRFPRLEQLYIQDGFSEYIEDLADHGDAISNLTCFSVCACVVPAESFIDIIRRLHKLKCLFIRGCSFEGNNSNGVIDALRTGKLGAVEVDSQIPCPLLEELTISRLELKAGPVIRLVQARLPPLRGLPNDFHQLNHVDSSARSPSFAVSPIRSLTLRYLESFDAKALPWLCANVPSFVCELSEGPHDTDHKQINSFVNRHLD